MCKASDFEIENGVLLKYHGPGGRVVIPEGVTSIGDSAFYYCSNVTDVVIPWGVTGIGRYAFRNCTEMTGVTIPKGVITIEAEAFAWCTHLTDITIPESVMHIGSDAFAGCKSLTGISFPCGITTIPDWLFESCENPASIIIPWGITRIPDGLFSFCENLTNVFLPGSVTEIGRQAFECCHHLTSIVIPDRVVEIGSLAFQCCRQLTSVVLPEGVMRIGYAAFNGCESLKSISIPNSVRSIGQEVFDNCTGLTDLTIPAHLATDLNKFLGKQVPPTFALHVADITAVSAKFRPNAAAGFAVEQRDGTDESGKQYLKYIRSHAAKLAQIACIHPELLYRMIREKLIPAKDLEAVAAAVQASSDAELISAMLEYSNNSVLPQAKAKAAAEQDARKAAVADFILDAQHSETLSGMTFVVTGKLTTFRSRDTLRDCLEAVNARLEETLTEHTDFLLTNTPDSSTRKNQQAEKLGVRKITEAEFNQMIGRKAVR